MCRSDPIYAFAVTESRLDKAVEVIRRARQQLTQERAFEVFHELGYTDAIREDENGATFFELTDLQLVAVAAAIACAAETGGKMVERTPFSWSQGA